MTGSAWCSLAVLALILTVIVAAFLTEEPEAHPRAPYDWARDGAP